MNLIDLALQIAVKFIESEIKNAEVGNNEAIKNILKIERYTKGIQADEVVKRMKIILEKRTGG